MRGYDAKETVMSYRWRNVSRIRSDDGLTLHPSPLISFSGGILTLLDLFDTKVQFNKLTSVFHASVLLLIMNFVITLSK